MTNIEVQAPGLLTTVQDLGRPGFGPIGVSPSGAADALSLRLGNLLVGNPMGAAGLEMTLLGGTFLFPDGGVVALAGSEFGATLDGAPIQLYASFEIGRGQALRLGPTQSGARCYLCVRGGIAVKPFLGSASTHLLSGLGGFGGRPLKKGDVLPIGLDLAQPFRKQTIAPGVLAQLSPSKILRVTPGPQSDWFPESTQRLFYEASYRVAEESNRMGLRLDGPSLAGNSQRQMISEGVPLGAVQVQASGQPIILFVEQQTTGGYPKIANVISADLHSVGQLRPRDEIRFERCVLDQARSLLLQEQEKSAIVPGAIPRMKRIDLNSDTGEMPEAIADGTQESLMRSLTSISIACGGHAGDEHTMQATIDQALRHKTAIGAHPSYPDRANFGRLEMNLSPEAISDSVFEQTQRLAQVAARSGARIVHVKAHGALYNQAARDRTIAEAIARGVARWNRDVVLVGLAGSPTLNVFRDAGFRVAAEAFADRCYEPDGSLRSRKFADALISDPAEAAQQALRIAEQGSVLAHDGSKVAVTAQTICIHSDTPGAPEIAAAVAAALCQAGIALLPLSA